MNSAEEKRAKIGTRLREARKLAGLSQGQVARLLGMHRPTISEIEAGNRRVTAEEVGEFARIYQVESGWLLGDVPETIETDDPRIQLAARELNKLKPEDLERMLRLLSAIKAGGI